MIFKFPWHDVFVKYFLAISSHSARATIQPCAHYNLTSGLWFSHVCLIFEVLLARHSWYVPSEHHTCLKFCYAYWCTGSLDKPGFSKLHWFLIWIFRWRIFRLHNNAHYGVAVILRWSGSVQATPCQSIRYRGSPNLLRWIGRR